MARLIATQPVTVWPPPCPLGAGDDALRQAFQGPDGSQPITKDWCLAQRYEGAAGATLDWSEPVVDAFCAGMASGTVEGTYGAERDARVRAAFTKVPGMAGSVGMVLGSEKPWVECLGLAAGASEIWTFEYATIVSR